MKINWKIVAHDLTGSVVIPCAPALLRAAAQHIIEIVERTPPIEYSSMSNLDKKLLYEYWKQIDGMEEALEAAREDPKHFYRWFLDAATSPETISRARRWLIEHNYIIISSRIGQQAIEAGQKYRSTF